MVISPRGRTGVYRKLHLAPPEADHFSSGESLPVFHWSGIRFGIQLCYDAHFPQLSTQMAEADADMIFIPHASPRGQAAEKHQSWMRHLPARAFDNGLFVVACNQTGDNGNGLVDERGLCFELVDGNLNIRLSLEGRDPDGFEILRTFQTSVWLRN